MKWRLLTNKIAEKKTPRTKICYDSVQGVLQKILLNLMTSADIDRRMWYNIDMIKKKYA